MPRDWRAKWNVTLSPNRAPRVSGGRSTALANWSTWLRDTGQRPTAPSRSCATHLAVKWISGLCSAGRPIPSASNRSPASSTFTPPVKIWNSILTLPVKSGYLSPCPGTLAVSNPGGRAASLWAAYSLPLSTWIAREYGGRSGSSCNTLESGQIPSTMFASLPCMC